MSVDFWKKEMGKITDNREVLDTNEILGKEKSSNSTLTKDGGAYFTSNGEYLGQAGESTEIRVIDWDAAFNRPGFNQPIYGGVVPDSWIHREAFAHLVRESKTITSHPIPVYDGRKGNYEKVGNMKTYQLLDLVHVMYGEQKGNYAKELAHVLYNREIFFGKKLTFDEEKNVPIYGRSNLPDLRQFDYLRGNIFDYSLATLHFWYPEVAGKTIDYLKQHLSVFRNGTEHSDGGRVNLGYKDFYALKSQGIKTLIDGAENLEWVQGNIIQLFKSIFDARASGQVDPKKNIIGWEKENGVHIWKPISISRYYTD